MYSYCSEAMRGLTILGNTEMSESSLRKLIETGIYIRSLNVSGCGHVLEYSGFKAIFENCNYLENLNLNTCHMLDDEGLKLIADHCSFLISIDIGHCILTTDVGIEVLSVSCSRIKCLNMQFCSNVTDRGMTSIAKNLKNLQHLNIMGCENISDKTLIYLGDYCKNLMHLNIVGCINVTGKSSFRYILHEYVWFILGCDKLTTRSIIISFFISDNGIRRIARSCTDLQI